MLLKYGWAETKNLLYPLMPRGQPKWVESAQGQKALYWRTTSYCSPVRGTVHRSSRSGETHTLLRLQIPVSASGKHLASLPSPHSSASFLHQVVAAGLQLLQHLNGHVKEVKWTEGPRKFARFLVDVLSEMRNLLLFPPRMQEACRVEFSRDKKQASQF